MPWAPSAGIAQEPSPRPPATSVQARGELEGKNVLHLRSLDAMSEPRLEEMRDRKLRLPGPGQAADGRQGHERLERPDDRRPGPDRLGP